MVNKYYQLAVKEDEKVAEILIYGDITSWEWFENDVSSYTLAKEIQSLPETIEEIKVYINSYGGEVAEGLAIHNSLKRHKAKVTTVCDGFAASIASVIFMAGDERIMNNASLLFIHNAWSYAAGDSNGLKKAAEDLEKITQASVDAYMEHATISEDELKELMDSETWLSPTECLDYGFCTGIVGAKESEKATQSVRKSLMQKLLKPVDVVPRQNSEPKEPDEPQEPQEPDSTPDDSGNEPRENLMLKLLEAL